MIFDSPSLGQSPFLLEGYIYEKLATYAFFWKLEEETDNNNLILINLILALPQVHTVKLWGWICGKWKLLAPVMY